MSAASGDLSSKLGSKGSRTATTATAADATSADTSGAAVDLTAAASAATALPAATGASTVEPVAPAPSEYLGGDSSDESPNLALYRAGKIPHVVLSNGVTVETIEPGDASTYPIYGSFCRIHYEVRTVDDSGVVSAAFDSSERRGTPYDFQIGAGFVLQSLETVILLLSRGQRVRIVLPPRAAYGAKGHPPVVPANATLEYTIELISMQN